MAKSKTCNLSVESRKSDWETTVEDGERIINTFFKKWKESDILDEIRRRAFYEKPSVKKHRAKRRRKYLGDINTKIILGQLKPRNKRLHQEILENHQNGKTNIRRKRKK